MADNLSTSAVSLSSNGTSKRCVRHHHRSGKHHHHHSSESCTSSMTSDGNDPSSRHPSIFTNTSSLSLIEPFSPSSRYHTQTPSHSRVPSNQKQPHVPTSKSSTLKKPYTSSKQPSVQHYRRLTVPSARTILSPGSCKHTAADGVQQSFLIPPQLSAIDKQPSAIDTQPSAIVKQPSAIDKQPSAIDTQPSAIDTLPSAIDTLPSAIDKQPSAIDKQPSAIDTQPSAIETQLSAIDTQLSVSANHLSTSIAPSALHSCQDESSLTMQPSACEEDPTAMQQEVLRVVDSCTMSIKSNTLDLLMAMDREQDRMVRELSDRMKSIQLDHDMLMALERFGEEEYPGEEGCWTVQWEVVPEGQPRSPRGSNRLPGRPPSERSTNEGRVLLGVPIRPSRYQKRDPSGVDSKGDKYLVLADSPYYRRTGGPRLVFAWPELYPPPRPFALRAVTSLLRLTAHSLHTLALLHLRPCTEYERTRAIPWTFPAPPPAQRRQYDVIEPIWGEGEAQASVAQASLAQKA